MFRAGGIAIAATLLVAAIPIPKSNPSVTIENQRPLQGVEHQTPSDAAHDNGGDKPAPLPEKQTYIENPHGNEDTDIRPQWGIVGREVIETISIAVTALFTVFLALWTNGLRAETKKLVAGADDQAKKLADAISAMNALATETRNLVTEAGNQVTEMHSLAVAAARSATTAERALVELERPYLSFLVKNTGLAVSALGKVSPTGGGQSLVCWFENIGRTPAILLEHWDNVAVVRRNQFPEVIFPDFIPIGRGRRTVLPTGVAIGPKLHYTTAENMVRKPLEDENWTKFSEPGGNRSSLFVYGFIRFEDIFGAKYCMGYCSIFDLVQNRFVRIGGPQYNYLHKEED